MFLATFRAIATFIAFVLGCLTPGARAERLRQKDRRLAAEIRAIEAELLEEEKRKHEEARKPVRQARTRERRDWVREYVDLLPEDATLAELDPAVRGEYWELVRAPLTALRAYVEEIEELYAWGQPGPVGYTTVSVRPSPSAFAEQARIRLDLSRAVRWVAPHPSGAGYRSGDVVKFGGRVFRSRTSPNYWSPADFPEGWDELESY